MINSRDGRWVCFVRGCLDDVRAGMRLFGRYPALLVLSNRLTYVNVGAGKRKCVANDNASCSADRTAST